MQLKHKYPTKLLNVAFGNQFSLKLILKIRDMGRETLDGCRCRGKERYVFKLLNVTHERPIFLFLRQFHLAPLNHSFTLAVIFKYSACNGVHKCGGKAPCIAFLRFSVCKRSKRYSFFKMCLDSVYL